MRSIKASSISNSAYDVIIRNFNGDLKGPTIALRDNSKLDSVLYSAGSNPHITLTTDESKSLYSI